MNQFLFFLVLIGLIWAIFKVSKWIWRVISFMALLAILWYFRETLFFYLNQYSERIPNESLQKNIQLFLQNFADKLNQLGQNVTQFFK